MGDKAIYVEIEIKANADRVWQLTQDPAQHPRWDLRFSSITPVAELPTGGNRFVYQRRTLLHTITGTGTSLGERQRPDGTRTSALRFTTSDRVSPLRAGRGYWRYLPTATGTTFITGFNYEPGWGRLVDRVVMRRLIGWITAWSFDRLRIWAETGTPPERWPLASVLAFWRPTRPKASRCRRTPRNGNAMTQAPVTLHTLEAP
ncbi:SRPBCC family protein [Cryobacterium sp. PH31-AA6]|uniref:SRPBCC family protein n=1 Tax=Cryobacterium sp. PH31-AA6 TaxID=3046205 RepID=UPI0024B9F710|nr:SRPBCC family protein [Cryobacterium sp. PH31-AA6]MDJ0325343.1 SRPBCC family protein [Cryobacterium sp. PH31-AA6]